MHRRFGLWLAFGIFVSVASVPAAEARAQSSPPPRVIRSIYPAELGFSGSVGLSYDQVAGVLLVFGGPEQPVDGSTVSRLTLVEDPAGSVELDTAVTDPMTTAFDPVGDRLVFLDRGAAEIVTVAGPALRQGGRASTGRSDASAIASVDPAGSVFDASGALVMLDSTARQLVRIGLDSDGDVIDGAGVTRLPLSGLPAGPLRGLAVHPDTGHLFVSAADGSVVYELDAEYQLVATHDLAGIGLRAIANMVFAPSGDPTDDPAEQSLYVLDAAAVVGGKPSDGVDDAAAERQGPAPDQSRIVEVSFEPMAVTTMAAPTDVATLVQTIDSSGFSPPSPDSAGIVYLPGPDELLVSDSEVNEMPIFAGANLFHTTRTGSLTDTGVTTWFSDEPTGLARNPANGHIFVSDDDADEVYEIDPGPDGRIDAGDTVVGSIDTSSFGNTDPEGVTYDSFLGELVIVEGLGREVFRVSPGPNGVFDGIDDTVSNFDVGVHGMDDPEGIVFDPNRNTVYVVDRGPDLVFEFTAGGALVRTIDISAAGSSVKASGIAIAPTSNDPTEESFYVTDRGVDNNSDPKENDGKIYELTVSAGSGNLPPTVSAGPDQTAILGDTVVLDGTVSDDGLPDPPGTVTTMWNQTGGPGTATFNDPTAVDTTVTFDVPGIYTVELSADDTDRISTDQATIEVLDPAGPFTLTIPIATGTHDAEERVQNSQIFLTSGDLDMTDDHGRVMEVGLRFTNVALDAAAQITNATLQFRADEASSGSSDLTIQGEATSNPAPFTTADGDITTRPRTATAVGWTPPAWTKGDTGPAQQTSDLGPVIEELVTQPGWVSGNDIVLIVTGTGHRSADSYEGSFSTVLEIVYTLPDPGLPNVSITATDPTAAEPADPGEFTITRTGPTTDPLTVTYTVTGTATAGVDYTALSGSVTIGVGFSTATVRVTVLDDSEAEPPETVDVTISADVGYMVSASSTETVTIADDEPTISVVATDVAAAEPADPGEFTFTRTGPATSPLSVLYTVAGTATNSVDYTTLSGTVTIGVGFSTATVAVEVIDDTTPEPAETVDVTIAADPAYVIGAAATDTVNIADDDGPVVTGYFAISEVTVLGRLGAGDLNSTIASDDLYEVLIEHHMGGRPQNRISHLDHQWTFDVGPNDQSVLIIEARGEPNTEGDDFELTYSLDGGAVFQSFVPALMVTATPVDVVYQRNLPPGTVGTVIIRATDTDRTPGNGARDRLWVDQLLISATAL